MKPLPLIFGAWFAALWGGAHLAAASLLPDAPLFTRISGAVVIPAENSDRGMYVDVTINGHGPFRMLVDTGSSVCIVSPQVADAVQARLSELDGSYEESAIDGLGVATEVQRVILNRMEVGSVVFEGVTAGVASLDGQSGIEGRRVDGLLGFSLFADIFVALDFPRHRLVLSEDWPENLPPVRAELPVFERSEIPFITTQLQRHALEVLIDSGSSHGLQFTREIARSVEWKLEPRPGTLVETLGAREREWVGRMTEKLEIGAVALTEPVVAITDGRPALGMEFLKSFAVVFQHATGKMWLCSNRDGPLQALGERSVGLSLMAENTGWRVVGIVPGSPAEEAHVPVGTLVTTIEGERALEWSQEKLRHWIDTHDQVALRLVNDNVTRDLTLRVWALVP